MSMVEENLQYSSEMLSPGSLNAAVPVMKSTEACASQFACIIITARVAATNQGAIPFYRLLVYDIDVTVGPLRPGSAIPVFPTTKKLEPGSA